MANIRSIKREFFTSNDIICLSPLARLLYIGIWLEADREGRFAWHPSSLKVRYLPTDECDIDEICRELLERGLVVLYEGDQRPLAHVPTFLTHQRPHTREAESKLPPPVPLESLGSNPRKPRRASKTAKADGHHCLGSEDPTSHASQGSVASTPAPTSMDAKEVSPHRQGAGEGNGTEGNGRERNGREGREKTQPAPATPLKEGRALRPQEKDPTAVMLVGMWAKRYRDAGQALTTALEESYVDQIAAKLACGRFPVDDIEAEIRREDRDCGEPFYKLMKMLESMFPDSEFQAMVRRVSSPGRIPASANVRAQLRQCDAEADAAAKAATVAAGT